MTPVVKVRARQGHIHGWRADEQHAGKPAILIVCDSESDRELVLEAITPALEAVAFAQTLKEPSK